jgi:hypothetical protein
LYCITAPDIAMKRSPFVCKMLRERYFFLRQEEILGTNPPKGGSGNCPRAGIGAGRLAVVTAAGILHWP